MDDLTVETGPLNPYARFFFSLWGLIVFLIVCFRLTSTVDNQQATERQRIESLEPMPRISHPPLNDVLYQHNRIE